MITRVVIIKSDISNNRGNGNLLVVIHKIPYNVPGKHDVKEVQKTAIMGTAEILRKVLTTKHSSWEITLHVP